MMEHLSLLILSWKTDLGTHVMVYFYLTKTFFLPLVVSKLFVIS